MGYDLYVYINEEINTCINAEYAQKENHKFF